MQSIGTWAIRIHSWLNQTRRLDFLAPLLLRLFLASVFISAGWNKAASFDSTVDGGSG